MKRDLSATCYIGDSRIEVMLSNGVLLRQAFKEMNRPTNDTAAFTV